MDMIYFAHVHIYQSDTNGNFHTGYKIKQKLEHAMVRVKHCFFGVGGWLHKYKAYVKPQSHTE